jgi:riboflavin kinase
VIIVFFLKGLDNSDPLFYQVDIKTMNQLVYVKNTVVRGFGRGSKELGCPTANVAGANEVDFPTGIYCGLAQLVIKNKDQIQPESGFEEAYQKVVDNLPFISPVRGMVCSFGYNPQYGNKDRSLEVHILDDFQFNFYQAELRVLICKKMRDEEKYNSLDELKQAIANDIRNATQEVPSYIKNASNMDYFIEVNNNDERNSL